MSRIDLPRDHWFVSKHEGCFVTNTYSGSLGTIADQGCISTRTFNYRIYVGTSSGEETNFHLIVESYIIQPWDMGGHKTDFERAEFERTKKGVQEVSEWLAAMASKYGF